jgi:hypothetical protein
MKKSKDSLVQQLTTAEKTALVAAIKQTGCTHIAISVPMDDNDVFIDATSTPSPRTAEEEVQDWCDVIHAAGLKVLHRGAFGGIEHIFDVPFDTTRDLGDADSAPTDGNDTWCGKYYRYLYDHVGDHVVDGDIFAPIPEGTNTAFGDNFFTDQTGYMSLFPQLHLITTAYGTAKGKSVVFMSHNNFSEGASGWLAGSLFSDQSLVALDYYGGRQGSSHVYPTDYVYDWQQLYLGKDSSNGGNNQAGSYDQFWSEWGDLPAALPSSAEQSPEAWAHWLIQFYKALRDNLVPDNGHLIGFNYWGGWEGQNTSILSKTGSGASAVYSLNFRGKLLAAFFKSEGGMTRVPVITSGNSASTYSF